MVWTWNQERIQEKHYNKLFQVHNMMNEEPQDGHDVEGYREREEEKEGKEQRLQHLMSMNKKLRLSTKESRKEEVNRMSLMLMVE